MSNDILTVAQAAQYLQAQGVDEIFNGGGFQDVLDVLEK